MARHSRTISRSGLRRGSANILLRGLRWLDAVPYAPLAITLRLAVATVFWNSATTKLANWDTALALFADDYRLPLLPPDAAAHPAVSIEMSPRALLALLCRREGIPLRRPGFAVVRGIRIQD